MLDMMKCLSQNQIPILRLERLEPTLEDLFLEVIGKWNRSQMRSTSDKTWVENTTVVCSFTEESISKTSFLPIGSSADVGSSIGYLPDVPEFYGFMTPREYLTMCGQITGMRKEEIVKKSVELLKLVVDRSPPYPSAPVYIQISAFYLHPDK